MKDVTRRAVLAGDIVTFGATDASRRLCDLVASRAEAVLAPGAFDRLTALRREISTVGVEELLVSLGCERGHTWFDVLRLRAIESGGHLNPAAAPAYAAHRDSWFANPRAQINLWIPLADVTPESTFAIYPDYFARPVANSSAAFDLDGLERAGGFGGGEGDPAHHPCAIEPFERAGAVRIVCRRAEIVAFAGAHLHETLPHDTGVTRLSIDLRIVDDRDVAPPNVDDACRGSTLPGFRRR